MAKYGVTLFRSDLYGDDTPTPPYICCPGPNFDSVGNPRDQHGHMWINFLCLSPIDTTTIRVDINGGIAFQNGTFHYPFNGPASTWGPITVGGVDGYGVVLDYVGPLFDYEQTITVRQIASNVFSESLDESWNFYISQTPKPYLYDYYPWDESVPASDRSRNLSAGLWIQMLDGYWWVTDLTDMQPIVTSTINVNINGSTAFNGGTFYYPFNGPGSTWYAINIDGVDGYQVVFDYVGPLFDFSQKITVSATATTLIGQTVEYPNYYFYIQGDNIPPFIYNLNPDRNESNVPADVSGHVNIDILDAYMFVKQDSIAITIDGSPAFNGPNTFQTNWNGPSSSITPHSEGYGTVTADGYRIILDYVGAGLDYEKHINVVVSATDSYDNLLNTAYNFQIIKKAMFTNMYPADGATNIPRDVVISVDITDTLGVNFRSIDAYVNGDLVFYGATQTFSIPWDGPSSSLTPITDGYTLYVDNAGILSTNTTITFSANARNMLGEKVTL